MGCIFFCKTFVFYKMFHVCTCLSCHTWLLCGLCGGRGGERPARTCLPLPACGWVAVAALKLCAPAPAPAPAEPLSPPWGWEMLAPGPPPGARLTGLGAAQGGFRATEAARSSPGPQSLHLWPLCGLLSLMGSVIRLFRVWCQHRDVL